MVKLNMHGGDIYSYIRVHGKTPIDFSANTNPLGLPKSAKRGLKKSIDTFSPYPDVNCTKLKDELSLQQGVSKEHIILGNGAADLIFKICYAIKPENALLISPTFSEYEAALINVNCTIDYYLLFSEDNFNLSDNISEHISGNDIMFVCNPNNPTGRATDKNIILNIARKCQQENCILVIDQCFMEFVNENENYSFEEFLQEFDNVIILKAFTKIYAMAGLRLGYCLSKNFELLSRIEKMGQPWSVSTPAQVAGLAALKDKKYRIKTLKNNARERKYLTSCLAKIGFTVFESHANYLLIETNLSFNLYEELYKKGIIIRKCDNFRGLDGRYYRIAVKSKRDNRRLIEALSKSVGEKQND